MNNTEEFKRKLRVAEIKGILPKGTLLGEHLIALSTDNDTLENMLYDLNNKGSDAFFFGKHTICIVGCSSRGYTYEVRK